MDAASAGSSGSDPVEARLRALEDENRALRAELAALRAGKEVVR